MENSYLTTQLLPGDSLNRRLRIIRRIHRNYGKYFDQANEGIMLDIGPGRGELLEYLILQRRYSQVEAIDICSDVVEYCNARFPGCVKHVDDATAFLNERDDRYSVITMLHVLEHIHVDNAMALLKAACKALRHDGIIIIEVPNNANIFAGICLQSSDITHKTAYTNISLLQILKTCGFSAIDVSGIIAPCNNPLRVVQRFLLYVLNMLQKVICRIYLPNMRFLHDATIFAVAKK